MVVAIIALLVSMLLPSLSAAKTMARIVKAHAELRGITLALEMYVMDLKQGYPPTRFSCATMVRWQLPVELSEQGYLPRGKGEEMACAAEDVFNPGHSYRYKAPGPAVINDSMLDEHGSHLYVPDDFPYCNSENGRNYNDPKECPAIYAVWSDGPDPDSDKFQDNPGRRPLPRRFWCMNARDTGVITHFKSLDGQMYISP